MGSGDRQFEEGTSSFPPRKAQSRAICFRAQNEIISSEIKEIKLLRGGVLMYAAQARVQIDAVIGQIGHFESGTSSWVRGTTPSRGRRNQCSTPRQSCIPERRAHTRKDLGSRSRRGRATPCSSPCRRYRHRAWEHSRLLPSHQAIRRHLRAYRVHRSTPRRRYKARRSRRNRRPLGLQADRRRNRHLRSGGTAPCSTRHRRNRRLRQASTRRLLLRQSNGSRRFRLGGIAPCRLLSRGDNNFAPCPPSTPLQSANTPAR